MQFRRPRRPKEPVPCVRPKSHDAGEASFDIAKLHGAKQCRKVPAERTNRLPRLWACVNRDHQENGGAGQGRSHRLGDSTHARRGFGLLHWIRIHRMLSWWSQPKLDARNIGMALKCNNRPAKLPSAPDENPQRPAYAPPSCFSLLLLVAAYSSRPPTAQTESAF